MNDILLDPPPAPQPEKKETITFNKKNLAIAFLAVALFFLFIIILLPGDKSSSPATTAAPVVTDAPAPITPAVNKYDQYLQHVYNNSGQANSISKADLIEYGDIICQSLDQGKTIAWIVNYLSRNSSGQSDMELYASVMYGAIHYICSEYTGDLNLYLNN